MVTDDQDGKQKVTTQHGRTFSGWLGFSIVAVLLMAIFAAAIFPDRTSEAQEFLVSSYCASMQGIAGLGRAGSIHTACNTRNFCHAAGPVRAIAGVIVLPNPASACDQPLATP